MKARLNRRALLIGTEQYQDERFPPLPCTRADIAGLHDVLRHPEIGVFSEVRVHHDLAATDFRSVVVDFLTSAEPDELTLLYVSGHGARRGKYDGQFFFVTTDTNPDDLENTAIGAGFVNHELESCYARQRVVLLDACFSGGYAVGLRTDELPTPKSANPATSGAAPQRVPFEPRGVYVLSSSAPSEQSFAGGGTTAEPEPSVFTGAVIDTLRTGAAGASESGDVTVDELRRAVDQRLRDSGQTPMMSTTHVSGDILIAARPRRPVPISPSRRPTPPRVPPPGEIPQWSGLLSYYRAGVDIESNAFPFILTRSGDYAYLTGRERLIVGDAGRDGTVELPLPARAVNLLARLGEGTAELWTGWPLVTVPGRRGEFAPLLIRRLTAERLTDQLVRLELDSEVQLHPGLVDHQLEERAQQYCADYQPNWLPGESDRLAAHAVGVLDELGLRPMERLHPSHLSEGVAAAAPATGAFNAALVFLAEPNDTGKRLAEDFKQLTTEPRKLARIPETALAPLLDGHRPGSWEEATPVTPLPANSAQLGAIRAAMTRQLTVVTGPPGTGKSQLIVNTVATALAAGQSVLVASTNNEAVNEVKRRCDSLAPGMLMEIAIYAKAFTRLQQSAVFGPEARRLISNALHDLEHH